MRVVVPERRVVALLLAGERTPVRTSELVDDELRAIAVATIGLRAAGLAPDEVLVVERARADGHAVSTREVETLLREGWLWRAAA